MDADEMTAERPAAGTDEGYAALIVSPAVAANGTTRRRTPTAGSRPPAPVVEPAPAEVAEPQPAAPHRSGGSTRTTAAAAVLAVLLLVATAAAGLTALRVREASGAERARGDALAAARSHAVAILSYDHRTLDADFARAQQVITGSFKGEYDKTTSAVVRPTATQYKAVVKAEVTSAAVVSATSHRVVVLLFVDQTTTSTRLAQAKRDASRVRMTLDKVAGRWLVSEIDAL